MIVLWTLVLLGVLVTAMAGNTRLSAQAAFNQQEELTHWANVLAAVNQAEMELILERMPLPAEMLDDPENLDRNRLYRFNGGELELYYPAAPDIVVRVYDHGGKINLREINGREMRNLLEKRLGEDADEQIDELLDAWEDWTDLNDGVRTNGAEIDYYMSLEPPYEPRNGDLESVDEILLIRGFAEVFGDIDLDAAFTLYSDEDEINLNLATVEAMRLLPGLDDELIQEILIYREEDDFRGIGDVAQIVPAENMFELRQWLDNDMTTNFYTIIAYPRTDDERTNLTAYAEIVEIDDPDDAPEILRIDPYTRIPLRNLE